MSSAPSVPRRKTRIPLPTIEECSVSSAIVQVMLELRRSQSTNRTLSPLSLMPPMTAYVTPSLFSFEARFSDPQARFTSMLTRITIGFSHCDSEPRHRIKFPNCSTDNEMEFPPPRGRTWALVLGDVFSKIK